jgi:hypothetical protein
MLFANCQPAQGSISVSRLSSSSLARRDMEVAAGYASFQR